MSVLSFFSDFSAGIFLIFCWIVVEISQNHVLGLWFVMGYFSAFVSDELIKGFYGRI